MNPFSNYYKIAVHRVQLITHGDSVITIRRFFSGESKSIRLFFPFLSFCNNYEVVREGRRAACVSGDRWEIVKKEKKKYEYQN